LTFLRYADEDSPRSHLYIIHVVHGARYIDAYSCSPDDHRDWLHRRPFAEMLVEPAPLSDAMEQAWPRTVDA
jgi:hypothetical protein